MKNNKTKFIFIILIFAAICATCIGGAIADVEVVFKGERIEAEYKYYAEITVPIRYAECGGKTYSASATVTYPSGRQSSLSRIVLSEIGEYSILYKATVDGSEYTDTVSFEVKASPENMWLGEENSFLAHANAKDIPLVNEKGAMLLSAYERTEIRYANDLYLWDNGGQDDLVTFMVRPSDNLSSEMRYLYLIIEDAEDSSNRLYVRFFRPDYEDGANRYFIQVSVSTDGGKSYTGTLATIKNSSFYGYRQPTKGEPYQYSEPLKVSLNARVGHLTIKSGERVYEINLRDESYVGFNNAWKGLTNGWARLSFAFEKRLTNGPSSIAVYSVDGYLMDGDVVSGKAPTVAPANKVKSDILYAKQGMEHKFVDYKAVCGAQGKIDIARVSVYKVDGNVMNSVKAGVDGFIPAEAGNYYVEYVTEKNYAGLTGKSGYYLEVVESSEYPISFGFGSYASSYKVGERINISAHTVSGGMGDIKVTYKVKHDGETKTVYSSFVPELSGEYELIAECKDEVQTVLFTKNITVSANSDVFVDFSNVPSVVMKGDKIDLSRIETYKYESSGRVGVERVISVGGSNVTKPYTFSTEGNVTVKVNAGGVEKTHTVQVKAPSTASGKYVSSFVTGANASVSSSIDVYAEDDTSFSFIRPISKSMVSFDFVVLGSYANFESLTVKLSDSADASNVVEFDIAKGYSSSPNYSIVTYAGKTYSVFGSMYDEDGLMPFRLSYDNERKVIRHQDAENAVSDLLELTTKSTGEEFEGFKGDVYLSFEINGVTEESCVMIEKIVNQSLSSSVTATKRNSGPDIAFSSSYKRGILGVALSLDAPEVWDVFEEIGSVEIKIKNAKGETVYSQSNLNKISYMPTVAGDYTVECKASDVSGNTTTESVVMSIVDTSYDGFMVGGIPIVSADTIAPTVTIGAKPTEEGEVGVAFNIAKITVEDNKTALSDMRIYVYVISPDAGRTMIKCTPSKTNSADEDTVETKLGFITDENKAYLSFTPVLKGEHRVYYVVTDGNDLSTIEYYVVNVK